MWGTATSAYQIEGAYQDEGKGLSIWDAFTHTPGKISGNVNADISCCHFYRCAVGWLQAEGGGRAAGRQGRTGPPARRPGIEAWWYCAAAVMCLCCSCAAAVFVDQHDCAGKTRFFRELV